MYVETVRILTQAMEKAEKKGFCFQDWYNRRLNFGTLGRMSDFDKIKHLCYLGVENVLVLDKEFITALKGKRCKGFLSDLVNAENPVLLLEEV